jgi:formylglycine-generating enzyme required for sulfatase activity
VLSSCSGQPDADDVRALLEKTLQNMVFVKGGTFMMGDSGGTYVDKHGNRRTVSAWTGYRDNKPAHKVTLDSYYIGKFEVTYGEYDIFTKLTGRPLRLKWRQGRASREPNIPVGVPNWYAAKAYCTWLSKVSGLPFDLPTEAQWEYAARSRGRRVPYATDNGRLDPERNYNKAHPVLARGQAKPTGSHPPNPLGLYDMHGNVAEWVNDWYDRHYYHHSPVLNPRGPKTGKKKLWRGGGNFGTQAYNTVYTRADRPPTHDGGGAIGMRCVLNLKQRYSLETLNRMLRPFKLPKP